LRHKAAKLSLAARAFVSLERLNTFRYLTPNRDALTLSSAVIRANPSKDGDAKPPV
jgi:hypothetical protein